MKWKRVKKMKLFLEKFFTIFDGYMLALCLFVGIFLLLRDVPILRKKKLMKDMKIAKFLGYAYIIGGITLFIIARIFKS